MLKLDRIEHSVTLLRHRVLAQDAMQRNLHVETQRSIGATGRGKASGEHPRIAGRDHWMKRKRPFCHRNAKVPGWRDLSKRWPPERKKPFRLPEHKSLFDRLNAKTPAAISRGGRITICGCSATASRTRGSSGPQGSRAAWPARCHQVRLRCSCRRWPGLPRGR